LITANLCVLDLAFAYVELVVIIYNALCFIYLTKTLYFFEIKECLILGVLNTFK